MTKVVGFRVDEEQEKILKDFKRALLRRYGKLHGFFSNEIVELMRGYLGGEPDYIHTKSSVEGQATLNPGLVIPEFSGIDRRRARTIVKVLEHLTKGGKFVNECEVNEPLLRNVAKEYTSNYYSIRAVASDIMEKLTEERGGKRFLKLGVSERIRRVMGVRHG